MSDSAPKNDIELSGTKPKRKLGGRKKKTDGSTDAGAKGSNDNEPVSDSKPGDKISAGDKVSNNRGDSSSSSSNIDDPADAKPDNDSTNNDVEAAANGDEADTPDADVDGKDGRKGGIMSMLRGGLGRNKKKKDQGKKADGKTKFKEVPQDETDPDADGGSSNSNNNTENNAPNNNGISSSAGPQEAKPLKVFDVIRSDPIKVHQARAKRLERLAAQKLPELHAIGQIIGGTGFIGDQTEGAMCRYSVDFGTAYELIGGVTTGQTQIAYSNMRPEEEIPFNHPLDFHFAQMAATGVNSPRITFQSYKLDLYGRKILCGYGFGHFPVTDGYHKIEVPLWRPQGTPEQEYAASLLGEMIGLKSHEPLYESAWNDRHRIITTSVGTITLELFVITRFMGEHRVD